jgi:hypothetical protein
VVGAARVAVDFFHSLLADEDPLAEEDLESLAFQEGSELDGAVFVRRHVRATLSNPRTLIGVSAPFTA